MLDIVLIMIVLLVLFVIVVVYKYATLPEKMESFSGLYTPSGKTNLTKKTRPIRQVDGIPPVVHQLAPKNKYKWPAIWSKCQKSWKKEFRKPEFSYRIWNDSAMVKFVKQYYPEHYDYYQDLPKKKQRIDMARYFILHRLGGIYADMDYECRENFHDRLDTKKANVVESPYKTDSHFQNSLLASPKGNPFWLRVILESKKRFYSGERDTIRLTGSNLLDRCANKFSQEISILPENFYNPNIKNKDRFYQNSDVVARHHRTNHWTKMKY